MAYLGRTPAIGRYAKLDDIASSFNGSTTTFNLTSGGDAQVVQTETQLIVSLGGIIQEPQTDYTVSGSQISFTTAPLSGDDHFAILLGDTFNVGVPSDNTLQNRHIKSDAAIAMSKLDGASGTLSALTVDNININGNAITSIAGTDLAITPLSGQQIVLDGAIIVDAGVVTGATSITSSAFVGPLTGNVTGNASGTAATVTTAAQPAITSVGTLTSFRSTGIDDNSNALAMTIDSSERVGIGTASPLTELEVADSGAATIRISDSSVSNRRVDLANSGGVAVLTARDGASNAGIFLQGGADGSKYARFIETYIQLYTSNTEKVRIDTNGNVGIGTTAPGSYGKLTVNDTAAKSVYIRSTSTNFSGLLLENTNSSTKWQIGVEGGAYNTAGKLNIGIDGVGPALAIDASRNVGIGTATPGTKLSVVSGTNAGISVNDGTVNTILYNSTGPTGSLGTTTNHAMAFYANNAEHMRITAAGTVGIGTGTIESGFKLHVVGNGFFSPSSGTVGKVVVDNVDQRLVLGSYYEAGVGQNSFISSTNNAETGNLSLVFKTGTSERMRLAADGNIAIGNYTAAGNTLRYLDLQNSTNGTSAGAIIRLITDNAAGGTLTTVDIVKYKTGGFYINNNDTNAAAFTVFNVGGERMRITSAGNVGIGTTVPYTTTKLNVAGATNTSTTSYNPTNPPAAGQLDIRSTDAYGTQLGGKLTFSGNSGDGSNVVHKAVYGAIQGYKTNALVNNAGGGLILSTTVNATGVLTERMRILGDNGNVGIGIAPPTGQLQVYSASGAELIIGYQGAATNYMDATTQIFRNASKAETMRIASSGNLELNHSLVYKGAPSTIYNADVFPNSITVANGGTVNFPSFSGYLLVCSHTTGNTVIFIAGGGSTAQVGTIGGGGANASFGGNASIGGYTYTNTYGASQTLGFYCVRGRNTR